jgi:hypothetical protein
VGLDELLNLDDIRNATYNVRRQSPQDGLGVANAPVGVRVCGVSYCVMICTIESVLYEAY